MNNDLISRSELKKEFNLNFGGVSHAVIAGRIIDNAPAVDAVEVVRCRECIYATDEGEFGHFCEQFPYGGMGGLTNDDDFCSYGERKDGADGIG